MKNNKIIIISLIISLSLALGLTVVAAYDSSEDPLISLSYLTEVFEKEIMDKIENEFDQLTEYFSDKIERMISSGEFDTQTPPDDNSNNSGDYGYEVIELTTGDALYAVSACDIMLRAGEATCIAPDARQGIADYTAGVEIYNGQSLTKNHMCLIPRGDGRGIVAQSVSVFVMVRGDYTIVKK